MHKAGYECYAVGGAVRDLLAGKKPLDWDFTTDAVPEEILEIFPDGFYNNVFGTVGIKTDLADEIVEITTYRTETDYKDRRRPEKVAWGKSLKEDLQRRDFTINAIASDGKKIEDPFGGKKDLENKLIQTVGKADERFQEDALRLIRAVRLATELQFLIEKKTRSAIEKNASLIEEISKERIKKELFRILSAQRAADGVLLLYYTGLLKYILPELHQCFEIPQASPERHHIYNVGVHSVESLRHTPSSKPLVRLAVLLHDIGKTKTFQKTKEGVITFYNHEIAGARMIKDIAQRLRFSKEEKKKLVNLTRWHQFSMSEKLSDKAVRRFIRRVGKSNLKDMLDLRVGDRLGGGARRSSWRFELFKKRLIEVQKEPFAVKDLKVDGKDVMRILNLDPSLKVGQVLKTLFEKVINKELINERGLLLKEIKKLRPEQS